ncbi:RNB domain-containing ribonuclease [Candidatus Fermentibacteria bacterium]|nr:RNB domain-containing ribonuclease [Candidatus Fermentibacteria bacterium]
MIAETVAPGSLVLYKERPARVAVVDDRLQIEVPGGETLRVRRKDIRLLHPGPLRSLADLRPLTGEADAAWELLAGSTTTLEELAELAFGGFTPETAWAAWELIRDGMRFQGSPEHVIVVTPEEVARRLASRAVDEGRRARWGELMSRIRARQISPDDNSALADLTDLALGRSARSKILRELGRTESPEEAHALLLDLGHWTAQINPYPTRLGLPLEAPAMPVFPVPAEPRRDLTHHQAFAIDDDTTGIADDALSLHDGRFWVHVADPGSSVLPGDAADLEARGRGTALYLPEQTVPMFPAQAIAMFGLGCAEVSPALSFSLELTSTGARVAEVCPSLVRVRRLTYAQVEECLGDAPFATLREVTRRYQEYRQDRGAVSLAIPEVDVKVTEGGVVVRPVPQTSSRILVQEAMIMAGEATARWALDRSLPMPFACQELGGIAGETTTLSAMYATRRILRPRQYRTAASRHASLGLDAYVQVTSPLRRYLDLVSHQQIRAVLAGRPPLGTAELVERLGAVEAIGGALRAAEGLSNRHWTLVYLLARPGWRGQGTVVEKRGRTAVILIEELGLETSMVLGDDVSLDSTVPLILMGVSLAGLEAHFRIGA